MIPDLHLNDFRASNRLSEDKQEAIEAYQVEFFDDAKAPVGKGKKKKRRTSKAPWKVKGLRNSAYVHIKALDHQLNLSIGSGLDCFKGDEDDHAEVGIHMSVDGKIPPTLTLHLDEGSPAYSMTWFLQYQQQLRMLAFRNMFHRCWNDVNNAVSACGLRFVI